MRVLLNGDRNFHIAVYDLKSKEMNVWNSDEKDTSVKNFSVSPNGNVYVPSFSETESHQNIEDFNQNQGPFKPYTFSIYNPNGFKLKNVGFIRKHIQDFSVNSNGSKIIFSVK
ncbi:hypothetical protein V3851_20945 [Paenibacillus sp. M1]|uniref:Uncharacterized protein n=2 Tax=Paenibacillus TaxID=44249 RepID=A0A3P3U309_9BACL|nr:hypothetical protein [Paenibacillus oralis]RRJ62953.1 hypothetical protein EHV15_08465 [Paenibacillus oralis]